MQVATSTMGASTAPNTAASGQPPTPVITQNDVTSLDVNPSETPRSLPPASSQNEHEKSGIETHGKSAQGKDDSIEEKPRISRFTKDPDGTLTHDETTVDIVTVPCPGGDSLRSWNRDGLIGRYFGAPAMRDAEVERAGSGPSWVRQGIRREADVARIMLYEHPELKDGTTLASLADALLDELRYVRAQEDKGDGPSRQRPIIFIGHSIGGLVVKMALAKGYHDSKYEDIPRDCYGVAFFGTPHQGSSYFAMPSLASSIQKLLQLSKPLPASITDDLRVGNPVLLRADTDFKAIAHDLRVWTLYETIDSRLSGGKDSKDEGNAPAVSNKKDGIYFTAPLTSIKSAILGMRQERIFPLQSDHANVASFGRHNVHTLRLFLGQLASLIDRADDSVKDTNKGDDGGARWTLNLEQRVTVEVHGFFEDAAVDNGREVPVTRAWSTKLPLRDFLRKGPEECLAERLTEVEGVPNENQFLRIRGRTMSMTEPENDRIRREASIHDGLGIRNQLLSKGSPPTSPVIRPLDSSPRSAPEILPSAQQIQQIRRISSPPLPPSSYRIPPASRHSTPMRRPSPLIRAEFDQDLVMDRLSPQPTPRSIMSIGRSTSDHSLPYEYRDFPPYSQQQSPSLAGVVDMIDDTSIDASPTLPEAVIGIRKAAKDAQRRPSETVIVDDVPVAFAQPEASQRKFIWVHLPYNNPSWVKNIIETLQNTYKKDYSALYNYDFWASKHTRGRHSQHYAYFAKPGCYFSAPRTLSPRSHPMSPSFSPSRATDAISLCLFLPYLHFDSYKRLLRRRNLIFERLTRGRARPVPHDVAKADSMELQVIWEFLGHDPPINCRRTLDQYAYPSIRDTRARDDDQMLYKLTKERGGVYGEHHRDAYAQSLNSRSASYGSHRSWRERLAGLENLEEEGDKDDGIRNGNVLMVDQMWLWVVQSDTLLSFFPKRESDPIEGPLYQQADLRDSIFNEINVDLTRQCENALDLAALAALHAVTVLLDRASHPDLEIFRIFEEAISVLTEKLTSSLKTFRVEGFKDKASAYEPVENKERSIRARHKEEGRRAEQENRDNTSALLELRDLEDELLVLIQLFERQHAVLSSMLTAYSSPTLRDRTSHGRAFIAEAIRRVAEYRRRGEEMIQRVRSTRDDYDKLLQMVQRQAQVDEVRLSRLHADLASAQSRSVMIFTVFTVIFLPLTFFTGLFGMNTKEWQDENVPSLKFIGSIALPGSVILIVVSLVAAFSTHARLFLQYLMDHFWDMLRWVSYYIVSPAADKIRQAWYWTGLPSKRRKKQSEEKREARKGVKKEASDFWARHKPERERGYQVPEVNKKPARKKATSKTKKDSGAR